MVNAIKTIKNLLTIFNFSSYYCKTEYNLLHLLTRVRYSLSACYI